jgi:Nuclear protein 96
MCFEACGATLADISYMHLQDMAKSDVEKQLQTGSNGRTAVLSTVSGHQLAQAIALAAASGDVRLATLLAQVQYGSF